MKSFINRSLKNRINYNKKINNSNLNYIKVGYKLLFNFYIKKIDSPYTIYRKDLISLINFIKNEQPKLNVLTKNMSFKKYIKVKLVKHE